MNRTRKFPRLPALLATTLLATALLTGCAPAYHSYSGCCIDCHYCPALPLPYAQYNECVCHPCAAQPYLHADGPATDPRAEATVPPVPE